MLLSRRLHKAMMMLAYPRNLIRLAASPWAEKSAVGYLQREGAWPLLQPAEEGEIAPNYIDLANLHRLVRRRRPKTAMEFGVGFSTIAIAHALMQNHRARSSDRLPHLFTVDSSSHWLKVSAERLPLMLRRYVSYRHSKVAAATWNGELCSLYSTLPNIQPDFIYLDGPDATDVEGAVNGLGFRLEDGTYRSQAAADILLYESTLLRGTFILTDARFVNAAFLAANLRRRWRADWNVVHNQVSFELREWTSQSRFINPDAAIERTPAPPLRAKASAGAVGRAEAQLSPAMRD